MDPLIPIKEEMDRHRLIPTADLPRFHGGGVGYLAYDVVRYFEPRLKEPPQDTLGLPESIFMFNDTLLVFDHLAHTIKVVSHVFLDGDGDVDAAYGAAVEKIERMVSRLADPLEVPAPWVWTSPGRAGLWSRASTQAEYEAAVERAVEYTHAGDVIQVVPSANGCGAGPTPIPSRYTAPCVPSTRLRTCITWIWGTST